MGLGMGITVAPLSNTVMTSVSSSQAGTASGINNAVSRLAGVLATAILGAVALASFSGALDTRTAAIDMPPEARAVLLSQTGDLANTDPPDGLAPDVRDRVEMAIGGAFVDAFKLVFGIAAGLAWVSAVFAAVIIEPKTLRGQSQPEAVPQGAGDD